MEFKIIYDRAGVKLIKEDHSWD